MTDSNQRILVVDDEAPIRRYLRAALSAQGFTIYEAANGQEALNAVISDRPDIIILDLGLPDIDGMELVRQLRGQVGCGVLILTGRGYTADRVMGLELGADDYLTKPFSPRELLARIRALLRRSHSGAIVQQEGRLQVGALEVDLDTHEARLAGIPLPLTLAEFRILAALLQNRGHVVNCRALLQYALEYSAVEAEAREIVRVHFWRLRNKMGTTPQDEAYIENVRGIGYMIR
jgi:DNA-binding response OmpR family regulator